MSVECRSVGGLGCGKGMEGGGEGGDDRLFPTLWILRFLVYRAMSESDKKLTISRGLSSKTDRNSQN